jgi:sigma-E factor negative regulatory protein RseC
LIEQQGKVVSAANGSIQVRLGASSGCLACDAGKGCGAGVFGRLLQRRPVIVEFENSLGADEGQAVVVGLPETLFMALVTRLYLLPLLAGLAGAVCGHWMAGTMVLGPGLTDFMALIGAVLAATFVSRKNRSRQIEFPEDLTVHLLRKIS